MTIYRRREETLNTQLAILLSRFGVQADAETIQVSGRERPDVLFVWRGLRVVIEGKFADQANARQGLIGQPTVIHQPKAGKNQAGVSSHAS